MALFVYCIISYIVYLLILGGTLTDILFNFKFILCLISTIVVFLGGTFLAVSKNKWISIPGVILMIGVVLLILAFIFSSTLREMIFNMCGICIDGWRVGEASVGKVICILLVDAFLFIFFAGMSKG